MGLLTLLAHVVAECSGQMTLLSASAPSGYKPLLFTLVPIRARRRVSSSRYENVLSSRGSMERAIAWSHFCIFRSGIYQKLELCFGTTVHIFRSWIHSVVHGWHLCLVVMMMMFRSVMNTKKKETDCFLKSVAVLSQQAGGIMNGEKGNSC